MIGCLYEDRNGELWIGTESAGVMRMERKRISAFGTEAGLEQEVIDGTMLAHDGRVVVLTARAGRLMIKAGDRSGFRSLFPPLALQPADLGLQHWQIALEDHQGKWWIPGTNQLQVFAPPNARAKSVTAPERVYEQRSGLPPGRIDCMLEARNGDIWFGLSNSPHSTLMQWVRATRRFRSWEGRPGIPADRVPVALMQTRSGSIWISYAQGALGRYRDGQHTLLASSPGRGTTIGSVYEDDFGRLWIGRRNSTFFEILYPDGERPLLKEVPEVRAPFLRTIVGDSRGRLYLASEAGLIEYDPRTKVVRHFHESDGLPSDVVQNGIRDRSGAFWFGTGRGLMRFEPPDGSPEPPPRVWLDRVTVGGVVSGGLSDHGESTVNHLRFRESAGALKLDFNSIHFTSDVKFQYCLTPGDNDWSPPTTDRSVTYAGLRGGSYQFAVRAVDAEARSSQPARAFFTVVPPLWRTSWFLLTMAVLLFAALLLIYRTRVQHLLQLERLRMRIASDLHDDIGATLTHITVLSEQLRSTRLEKEVDDHMEQIVNAAREMTSSVADVVWSISPQRDHLSDLLSRIRRLGNDLCDAHDISFSLNSQDDSALSRVNGHLRHQLFLIFKEALRNAIRHSRCRNFMVECRSVNSRIQLVFQDDGIGFDLQRGGGGLGLISMQRRAALAGGALRVQSSPGHGTTITVSSKKL